MTDYSHRYSGACRCGAVRFTYYCGSPVDEFVARACQCDFCLPRGASYLSNPEGRLEVDVKDMRYLYAHLFGTATADFMHCAVCNELVFVLTECQGQRYGLVVAGALDGDLRAMRTAAVDHGAESLEARRARRCSTWIPDVRMTHRAN